MKDRMKIYFIEFEFTSGLNKYWFPLFYESENIASAIAEAEKYKAAIEEHYVLNKIATPKPFTNELDSNYIIEYYNARLKGKLVIMKVNTMQLNDMEVIPSPFTFTEYLYKPEHAMPPKTLHDVPLKRSMLCHSNRSMMCHQTGA